MGLIPFWRFPSDAGTVTATSTAGAGFAASNVQKQTLQKKWKSASGDSADHVQFALDAAGEALNTVFVGGHDFLEGDTTQLLMANDVGFTLDVVTETLTWHENYFFKTFTEVNRKFARVRTLKASDTDSRSAGRIVIGTSTELEHGLKTPGDMFGPGRTTSTSQRTTGGQLYGNLGVSMDVMRGTIPGLLADDVAEVLQLQRAYQTVTPFVSVIREGLSNQSVIYGTLDSMLTPKYVNEDRQEIQWRMTEQK